MLETKADFLGKSARDIRQLFLGEKAHYCAGQKGFRLIATRLLAK